VLVTEARQTVGVIVTFRNSIKYSLERRAGVCPSIRKVTPCICFYLFIYLFIPLPPYLFFNTFVFFQPAPLFIRTFGVLSRGAVYRKVVAQILPHIVYGLIILFLDPELPIYEIASRPATQVTINLLAPEFYI
jgi:hypothetical protein